MTKDEALKKVIADMHAMSAVELRRDLDKHKDGDFAVAMRRTAEFRAEFLDTAIANNRIIIVDSVSEISCKT